MIETKREIFRVPGVGFTPRDLRTPPDPAPAPFDPPMGLAVLGQTVLKTFVNDLKGFRTINGSSQGQNQALTVLHVPHSLDSGSVPVLFSHGTCCCGVQVCFDAAEQRGNTLKRF